MKPAGDAPDLMKSGLSKRETFLLSLFYLLAVSFVSSFHEVWRDEVAPFSLIRECRSPLEVFDKLSGYGHPHLWHLLLYFFYQLVPVPAALKILHVAIASAAVWLFLAKSPFGKPEKILFIFGYFPFYAFAVINRDYGLAMLCLFWMNSLYKERFRKPLLFAAAVFFLAGTHALSLIVSGIVLFLWALEWGWKKRAGVLEGKEAGRILGFLLMALGIVLAVAQILPSRKSPAMAVPQGLTFAGWLGLAGDHLAESLVNFHGLYFPSVPPALHAAAFLLACFLLLRKPFILLLFILCGIAFDIFFNFIYKPAWYHMGIPYLLLISAFWMKDAEPFAQKRSERILQRSLLILVLVFHLKVSWIKVSDELWRDYSSSKKLSLLIKERRLESAIVVSEPDYNAEALPYYTDNRIYIPREGRFGRATRFSLENKPVFSLALLLEVCERLKTEEKRPVVILMGLNLAEDGPYDIPIHFRRTFTYDRESLRRFYESTELIGTFQEAIGSEKYRVYLLK